MKPSPLCALLRRVMLALLLVGLFPAGAHADPVALRPARWKVTRQGTTIWLFGTIHMLPPGANWLTGPVAHAADTADEIATEIDDPDGSATRTALAARSPLPAGDHLSVLLPDDERVQLAERLARFGLGADRFDGDKPWYAAVALSTLPLLRRGFDARTGVEAGLSAREAERKVPHTGIETPDGQLAGQKLIEDHAQRVDVGPVVQSLRAPQLFGRHVAECAHDLLRGSQRNIARLTELSFDGKLRETGASAFDQVYAASRLKPLE